MSGAGDTIRSILGKRRIAVVGVSRKQKHYSRIVYGELAKRGYDLVPVHPEAEEIDGTPAAPSIGAVSPPPEAVISLTRPDRSAAVLADAAAAGVRDVWLRMKTDAAPPDPEMRVVSGHCPLMFLPDTGFIHRFHGFLLKLTGRHPLFGKASGRE